MRTIILSVLIFLLAAPVWGNSTNRSEELYRRAAEPGIGVDEKARLLEASLDAALSYAAAFELGRTYNDLGKPKKAAAAFERAAAVASDPARQSKALSIAARLYSASGDTLEAAAVYKRALKIRPSPDVEQQLRELEKNRIGISASDIAISLKRGLAKRSLGVQPSVDLRINFDIDSDTFSAEGLKQATELGQALGDAGFAIYKIKLVGHTDKRGTDSHNDRLSRQRAEAVRNYLAQKFGITVERLQTDGKGKREPIFMGDTEDDYTLNRRVEVVLVE